MTITDFYNFRGLLSCAPAPQASSEFRLGIDVETGAVVTMRLRDLLAQRLLIQGNSGAGKTTLVKHILSQTQSVQQVIIDQEGEYTDYAYTTKMYLLNSELQDVTYTASEARRNKRDVLVDLMQFHSEPKLKVITQFVEALIEAPKELWHPVIVVVDEAQEFAPRVSNGVVNPKIQRRCSAALIEMMILGRKRGLCGVICSQRLALLNPSVRASPQNYMIGFTMHDVDIHRAAEILTWPVKQATAVLASLPPGVFVCAGLAFGRTPRIVRVGPS